ncbi:MAG TPA: hypothetical protein VLJ57_08855 [Burkholderiaceae bacterium]|nr:hypothetical protein [Burkholderiaceae bacterium]
MLTTLKHSALLSVALWLAACAPAIPRMGNFGGAQVPAPPLPPDSCDVADPGNQVCWFPVQARFHPDGQRLVVNLCSSKRGAEYDCRMVEHHIAQQKWILIPGQEPGKSYFYPSYSRDGKTLLFSAAHCEQKGCGGNGGYGQLATMAVQTRGEQATEYGALKLLPVSGTTRAAFTEDDKTILYWRMRTAGRTVSGRSFGSISVYAYQPATDEETHLIPALYPDPKTGNYARADFVSAFTAPRFTLDGATLYFCGMGSNTSEKKPVPSWNPICVDYAPKKNTFSFRYTDRATKGLGRTYTQHPTLGFLAGPGNVRLVDAKTLANTVEYLDPGPDPSQLSDADISRQGDSIAVLARTISPNDGRHGPERRHLFKIDRQTVIVGPRKEVPFESDKECERFWGAFACRTDPKPVRVFPDEAKGGTLKVIPEHSFPVFALVSVATKQVFPIYWPNVEALGRAP